MQERPFWVFFVAKLAYFYVSPSGARTFKTNIKPYNYYGTFLPKWDWNLPNREGSKKN